MENPVMLLVTAFIGVSIMLSVAVSILSGVGNSFDCDQLDGYVQNGANNAAKYPSGTWAGTCFEVQESTQNSLGLLVVILVVIAAIAILVVVRML